VTTPYWSQVETVWAEICIYDGPEAFLSQFAAAGAIARTLFAAHWCRSEVLNGGFCQFFDNSAGVLAPEAAGAFEAIGMPEVAKIVRSAMDWFGSPYPRDRSSREAQLRRYFDASPNAEDPFVKWNTAFFSAINEEAGGFEAAANSYSVHRAA
jgi:Domain of unknown function (DUF4375)